MPAKGKHRRPKSSPIARGLVVAGTGSAALALPLMGATGAHAATGSTATTATTAGAATAVATQAPPAQAPAAAPGTSAVYTVVPGDYLSKIAAERHLSGGWQQVYADNREAVGADPSLIHPGLKLTLGARAQQQAPAEESAPVEESAPTEESAPAADAGSDAGSDEGARDEGASDEGTSGKPAQGTGSGTGKGSGSGAASASGFVAPVSASITTRYGASGSMWSSGHHTGVDFAVGTGTTVRAVGAGTVVSAGWGGAYGNEVVIRHADGRYSQYGHMSQLSVSVGQSVGAGQSIGLSGSTGNVTGPHLHFEIRTGAGYGTDVDPLAYLRSKGVNV
ncbi:peptidoglycan DD-metalloendopeptidase family protein [Streptomyces sp. NPDC051555]|uniref:peptidoglycan DD-metalloendopeptidase family protein n=1 Tax=Streptomyces sp. NPDC051555 TaxID=3365657 RepID=UPI00379FC96C